MPAVPTEPHSREVTPTDFPENSVATVVHVTNIDRMVTTCAKKKENVEY